jgi:hypothetical protein
MASARSRYVKIIERKQLSTLQPLQSAFRSMIESEVDRGLAMLSYALWLREHSPDELSEATFCSARRALSVARRFYSTWFLSSNDLANTEARIKN